MSAREFRVLMGLVGFAALYFTAHVIHAVVWGAWS